MTLDDTEITDPDAADSLGDFHNQLADDLGIARDALPPPTLAEREGWLVCRWEGLPPDGRGEAEASVEPGKWRRVQR